MGAPPGRASNMLVNGERSHHLLATHAYQLDKQTRDVAERRNMLADSSQKHS